VPHVVKAGVWNACPIARLAKLPNQVAYLEFIPEGVLNTGPRAAPVVACLAASGSYTVAFQGIVRRVPFLLCITIRTPRAKSTSCHCRLRISP